MGTRSPEPPVSKLVPATLHGAVVERHRMFRVLDQAVDAAPLTVVRGYAGAGKTVLLSSWATRSGRRVAWLSCDGADADPVRFWTSLVAAVRLVHPTAGADTLDRIELEGGVGMDAIGVFSNELRGITDPLVIVIDDLHAAADPGLWTLLTAFVEWLPPAHRLVVASRSEPGLPLHRWRLDGRLAEIGDDRLAFTEDEAAAMLEGLGATVERSAVSLLARRTEGWAAGLQLAALSARDRPDATTHLLDLAATDRDLVDYLTAEVLDRQPGDVTDFLLATSILRELDAGLCRVLTGDPDPQARLRDVAARGLFLAPLDRGRQRYRYHPLFGQLLQDRLWARDETRARQLHESAADWYASAGDLDLAVFHAVQAGRADHAVKLLRDRLVRRYYSGAPVVRTRLLDLLDDATLTHERDLALEFTLTIGTNGALDEAGRWLERLEHLAAAETDRTFQGRFEAARALWEAVRGGADRAVAHMARARELLDPTDDLSRQLAMAEARVLHYLDDLEGLRRLARTGPADDLPPMATVVMMGALGGMEADAGFLHTADRLARAALAVADETGTRQHYAAGDALRVVAAVQLERLELDTAETLLERALRTVERERPGTELLCLLEQVWLFVERHRLDEAFETVARAEALADQVGASAALRSRVAGTSARLQLLVGATSRAGAVIAGAPVGPRRTLAEARLAVATHRPTEAIRILESVETHRWPRVDLDVALVRAQALVALGHPTDAVDQELERALAVADEQRFVRSVLVEADVVGDSLGRVLRHAPQGSHRDELGQRLRTRVPLPRAGQEPGGPFAPSARELEILRHLATRLSNREIAEALFISVNTMKTHVRSLYRRLGVTSRSEAVAAGRSLGLV